jgi:glutamate racemase
VPSLAVAKYLQPLAEADVDVIVLGCTHYPALKSVVIEVAARLFSKPVSVIDSAEVTALQLGDFLREREMQNPMQNARGTIELLVTDRANSFAEIAARLLRAPLPEVHLIDL